MRSEPGDVHALRTESGPTCQALTNQVKGGLISPRGGGGGGGVPGDLDQSCFYGVVGLKV